MRKKPSEPIEEHIVDVDVSTEMRTSFLEYSYSVIYARALPDARDGFKPVQRRILFQMDQMGLRPDKGHVKSSRVVGDVMGKLHPHGDTAIYDAMVRMAQPFTMRLPLVDGHGNFGSLDDGPAAPRYTEVRLAPAALAMTASLDEDVVDMVPNYDNTLLQPEVLPAAIPNLLVNGASGIAVGMATNMPPHNLVEVIAGARYLLQHPDASLEDLMRFIPGPDLPEGGKIVGLDGVREAYETGRGSFRTRATAHIENVTARKKGIVFTELPFGVGPEKVIEKLKDAISLKKVQGVSGAQNLTDRHHGMRLVVEIKNGFNPEAVLAQLYRHTPLEDSFAINNVALVDGQPRTLGLKELLRVFLDHRLSVTRRRTQFRLAKARRDLHLVEGLLIAVLNIDEVIAVIRSADDAAVARERLQKVFDLSEEQAEYILELRLRRLTKYSQIELEKQRSELERTIQELQQILSSDESLRAVVSAELGEVARQFGTPRRTVLLESDGVAAHAAHEVPLEIEDGPCWVMLSGTGLVARTAGPDQSERGGPRLPHDAVVSSVPATIRGHVGVVSSSGMVYRLDVLPIPALPPSAGAPSLAGGARLTELLHFAKGERPLALVSLDEDVPSVALATRMGRIKRVSGPYPHKDSWSAITLEGTDAVVGAAHCSDQDQIILITSEAQLLRFGASAVRPQGRAGRGVCGIRLPDSAYVIALGVVPTDDVGAALIATVSGTSGALPGTVPGCAKVTPLDRFPAKGRGTGGVRAQRFLRGEDCLQIAAVGIDPLRAVAASGQPVDLPEVDERRDASGTPLAAPVVAIA
ncbi:MAG: DNA topoisomerase IV subunit A [Ancrocorticia sp.]|jgi:DNA gyrase subunit A|nr:DNA topoisomerase IV subunit A [Ancrocorticia sp.]MCI2001335.1 DNA topoisomerase IV subunit A [Ancrocorticia sp.]MCI2012340.1 DNA topoisomerase IV subunit A [Ancrocorticia sp.]MCI2028971.1 DNA topoisomerase IV subunit A [Ancrocorticia sp.]